MKEFWSADEECYRYDTLHMLILDNEDIIAGSVVSKGMFTNLTPEAVITKWDIEDIFYDKLVEYCQDTDDIKITTEDMKYIMSAIYKALDNAGVSKYWKPVSGTFEQYTITEEDLCDGL